MREKSAVEAAGWRAAISRMLRHVRTGRVTQPSMGGGAVRAHQQRPALYHSPTLGRSEWAWGLPRAKRWRARPESGLLAAAARLPIQHFYFGSGQERRRI